MRRSFLAAAALLALAACSDSTGSGKAGPPARLDIVSGDLQPQAVAGSELPQPLVVKVLDAKGKAVEGQLVNWVVTAGNGHLFAGASLTDGNGEARERWTLGLAAGDTQRVEARAVDSSTGQALVFGQFRAVGAPRPAAAVQMIAGSGQTSQPGFIVPGQLAVRVVDANGAPIIGAPLTWTVTSGTGTLQADARTDAKGEGHAWWTLGPEETTQKLTVASGSAPAVEFVALIAPPGTPGLAVAAGDDQFARVGQPVGNKLAFWLRGANGRLVPNAWVKVQSANGTVTPDSVRTDPYGMAQFNWTMPTTAGTARATFVAPATGATASVKALAQAGPATTLAYTGTNFSDTYFKPGESLLIFVQGHDAYGNVANEGITYSVTAGGGTFGGGYWNLGGEGAQALRVTAGTATLQLTTNTARVYVNIPGTPVVQNDSLELAVNTSHDLQGTINNPPPGVSVTVTVDGRTAPVTFSWALGPRKPWYGFLSLTGLAPGTKTARIDMTAPEGTFTRSFTFDYHP